jgi:hypothetical protein
VQTTRDPNTMIRWLNNLTADGGDDDPELSMHGLLGAIAEVRPGSTCYLYTDASAKDIELLPTVLSNAKKKNVEVLFHFEFTTVEVVFSSLCRFVIV